LLDAPWCYRYVKVMQGKAAWVGALGLWVVPFTIWSLNKQAAFDSSFHNLGRWIVTIQEAGLPLLFTDLKLPAMPLVTDPVRWRTHNQTTVRSRAFHILQAVFQNP
jgi:hypothetical protein